MQKWKILNKSAMGEEILQKEIVSQAETDVYPSLSLDNIFL